MPPDERLLMFPPSVSPCRSKVPKGFFVLADFVSLRFSVKFWRNSPPPAHRENNIFLIYFSRLSKLNENCFASLVYPLICVLPSQRIFFSHRTIKVKQQTNFKQISLIFNEKLGEQENLSNDRDNFFAFLVIFVETIINGVVLNVEVKLFNMINIEKLVGFLETSAIFVVQLNRVCLDPWTR